MLNSLPCKKKTSLKTFPRFLLKSWHLLLACVLHILCRLSKQFSSEVPSSICHFFHSCSSLESCTNIFVLSKLSPNFLENSFVTLFFSVEEFKWETCDVDQNFQTGIGPRGPRLRIFVTRRFPGSRGERNKFQLFFSAFLHRAGQEGEKGNSRNVTTLALLRFPTNFSASHPNVNYSETPRCSNQDSPFSKQFPSSPLISTSRSSS